MAEMSNSHERRYLLISGCIGLGGALLMFAGDMLLYGHFGSGSGFLQNYRDVIADATPTRLCLAGITGPVAASLYLIGFYHLYLQLWPAPKLLRALTAGSFSFMILVGGAFHAVWAAHAFVIKAAVSAPATYQELNVNVGRYMDWLYLFAEVPGYLAATLLFVLVGFNRTSYPRWMVLLNPGLLMLLSPLASAIPAPLGAVIVGGFFNLSFVLFFTQSLFTGLALSNKRLQRTRNKAAS